MENRNDSFKEFIDGLKSPNREQKLLSISALGILRVKEHANALIDLLCSQDITIVEQAIETLGAIGNINSVKYIVDFVGSENEILAAAAVNALSNFDITQEISTVIKACSSDLPPIIRKRYIDILIKYNLPEVALLISDVLKHTTDEELLTTAINYFIKFPSPDIHPALKTLTTSSNWNISLYANLALSRLQDESAYLQLRRLISSNSTEIKIAITEAITQHIIPKDKEILISMLKDQNVIVRETAMEGFSILSANEKISYLKNRLLKEPDINLKLNLIEKAKKEASPLLYNELYELIQSTDEEIQEAARKAIGAMGDKIVDRIIIDFDKMPLIAKEQIILILGQIGGEKVCSIVSECLFAKERWLRINAIDAASRINTKEMCDDLVKIISRSDTDIWVMAAVSALGKTGKSEYAPKVAELLNHEDARVRANAVEAVSSLNWKNLNEACINLLNDKNDRVRVNAAIALWKNGNNSVFESLAKMASSKSRWVRSSAVFALGKIKDKAATPILLTILSDQEDMVYRNAINALAEQGDVKALLPMLREMFKGRMTASFYVRALNRLAETLKS